MEVSETEAAKEPGPTPQVCTLDLELMINRLLGYKDNPGKQVKPFTIFNIIHGFMNIYFTVYSNY